MLISKLKEKFSNRSKELLTNSLLFAIGNLGTKLITLIMVPVYTYYLSTSNYGQLDLFITTMTMLTPIISLSIFDAVFRFTLDKGKDDSQVFSNSIVVTLIGGFITCLVGGIVGYLCQQFNIVWFTLMLFTNNLLMFLMNFYRGINKIKSFLTISILSAVTSAVISLYLLISYKNVESVLIGTTFGNFISIVLVFLISKSMTYWKFKTVSKENIFFLLKYSIPLIPNSFAWWFTNDAARFLILFFVGTVGNGIYGVASKIPAALTIFFAIFSQAWQISAINEYKANDREIYYSKVFNTLLSLSFIGVSLILTFLKPIIAMLFTTRYFTAWENVPFLLLSAVFSNISAFLGTTYIASGKTGAIMRTTIIGMIINMLFSGILIFKIGVQGAGIGSMIGFLCIIIFRLFGTKELVRIRIDLSKLCMELLLISMQIVSLWFVNDLLELLIGVVITSLLCIIWQRKGNR